MKEMEELLALEAKASKGPWDLKSESANGYGPYWGVVGGEYGGTVVPCRVDWEGYGDGASKENADFIIAARNLTPKMAQALKNLEELADHQEAFAAHLRAEFPASNPKTDYADGFAQVYEKSARDIRDTIKEALA